MLTAKIVKVKPGTDVYAAVRRLKVPGVYTVVCEDTGKVLKVLTKCGSSHVEQHHRTEIKKMVERAEANGLFRASVRFEGEMDDYPNYDFQEAQFMMAKAQSMFESMPSGVRSRFENNPAKFMDFVNNPKNQSELISMGLAKALDGYDARGNPITIPAEPSASPEVNPEASPGS